MKTGLMLAACAPLLMGAEPSLYINYSPHPPAAALLQHTVCILDPAAKVDLAPGQAKGNQFFAYLSLVELAAGSPKLAAAESRGVRFVGENTAWNSRLMDITQPEWQTFLLDDLAADIAAQGYDGFFLDTADSATLLPEPLRADGATALEKVVRRLKQRWPEKRLILNRGFDLLAPLQKELDGLLVESVYQTFDGAAGRNKAVPAEGSRWLEGKIRQAQALGLTVYAVDYVSPAQLQLAASTAGRLRALGTVPLITTPDLGGVVLAQ
jgi:polysaccharide biosynthesis protein PelA